MSSGRSYPSEGILVNITAFFINKFMYDFSVWCHLTNNKFHCPTWNATCYSNSVWVEITAPATGSLNTESLTVIL